MPRASGSPLAVEINSLPMGMVSVCKAATLEMVSVRWKRYVPLVVGRFTAGASPEPPMHMQQGLYQHDGTTNEATATEVPLRMGGKGGDCRLGDLSTGTKRMMMASQRAVFVHRSATEIPKARRSFMVHLTLKDARTSGTSSTLSELGCLYTELDISCKPL